MNKRMNKEELINLLDNLKIDKKEFIILSSSALVLRNLYEDAGDLDIGVTIKGLEQLKKNYNLIIKSNGWYIVNDKVECTCIRNIENLKYPPEQLPCGYYVQNIHEYFEYLNSSNREKDKQRIHIVKKYIKKLKIDI